jgi:predicted enzyme related to lactoylglutathione lyase
LTVGLVRIHRPRSARAGASRAAIVQAMASGSLSLIEFPADDPERARRFWSGLLDVELQARREDAEGQGWQTRTGSPALGVHERGRGPGDSFSLPYFTVADLPAALERVQALGGTVVHPGERWAICKDSEATPFALAQEALAASGG